MTETKNFCPLHLHSYYSFQDALSSPKEIAKRAKELGYPATAVTDHGHCHGLIKAYKECKKVGVKLIPACELYITPVASEKDRKSHHLTMLVQNEKGLSNLYKILSWANLPADQGGGFYHRPRTEWTKLEKYSEGLICLSGCMSSIVNAPFVEGNVDQARANAIHLMEIYGKDRFFIEVQDVNEGDMLYIPEQKAILDFGRGLAKELGLRCAASNDSHFINKDDAFSHEVLKTIGSRCTMSDPIRKHGEKTGRMVYSGYFYYMPSYEEMISKFTKEEVENTKLIADMVSVDIPLKQNHMPRFDPNLTDEQVFEKLRQVCLTRYKELDIENKKNKKEYVERITRELNDIKEAGLQNYFMIVWDVVRFCRENNIPVGMGRGSAGGSMISYLLRITGMDPMVYGLIWERFWNRGRKGSMPDIDLDISIDKRDLVVDYLKNKFGRDKVFPMVTFTTMATKAALKDVGKAMGLDFDYTNEMTKHVPHKCKSIDDAIARDDYIQGCSEGSDRDVKKWQKRIEDLKKNQDANISIDKSEIGRLEENINKRSKQLKKTFEVAKNLEDIARQKSCHACALLISDESIFGKIPTCYDPQHKKVLTAFDMYDLEELGYLKLDILGLKTLTAVIMTDPEGLDAVKSYDDPEVFALISSGNTKGIFQLESPLGKQWCQKMKPQNLEEIAALISIIRPAVLEQGIAADYIKNRANPTGIKYIHPDLEPILGPTHGAMIYQETMLEVVKKFAGFDLAKADLLRKAAGKKLPEEMAKYEKDFLEGCSKNGYTEDVAKELWEWINATADYSFNKCISGATKVFRGAIGKTKDISVSIEHLYKLKNDLSYSKQCNQKPMRNKLTSQGYGEILALDSDGRIRPRKIKDIMFNGRKETYRVALSTGEEIRATKDHKFFTHNGYLKVEDMIPGFTSLVIDGGYEMSDFRESNRFSGVTIENRYSPISHFHEKEGFYSGDKNPSYTNGSYTEFKTSVAILEEVKQCQICGAGGKLEHHHVDGNRANSKIENIQKLCNSCHKKADYSLGKRKKRWTKGHKTSEATVVSVEYFGLEDTYDIEMDTEEHNFIANGIVTSNSHAVGYGIMSYITAWMKRYRTKKFFTSLLKLSGNEPGPLEEISELFYDAKLFGIEICPPSALTMNEDFELIDGKIYYGLGNIKSIGKASINKLKALKPANWEDIIASIYRINKGVIYALILSGSFDCFGLTRYKMKSQVDFVLELTDKELAFFNSLIEGRNYIDKKKEVVIAGPNDFDSAVDLLKTFLETDNVKTKIINARRATKVLEICGKYLQGLDKGEMSIKEMAGREIFYLGIPATCSEVEVYEDVRKTNDLIGVKREIDEKKVSTIGIIDRVTEKTDKRGDKFVFITLADKDYKMDGAVWSNAYARYKEIIEVGKVVYVEGMKRKGLFQIDKVEAL